MDAIQDRERQIKFGTKWYDTTSKDYKFIWQGYNKPPVSCTMYSLFSLT